MWYDAKIVNKLVTAETHYKVFGKHISLISNDEEQARLVS